MSYPAQTNHLATTSPARAARTQLLSFTFLKITMLASEVMLIAFAFMGRIDLATALGVHLALGVILVGLVLLVEHRSGEASDLQKFTLQMIVAGPLGSASALIDEQLSSRVRAGRLAEWYNTIAPAPSAVVTLADRIRDDQVVRPDAKLPRSPDRLILKGSMREIQALFATVAADGRMEGVNLIERALRSRDQRVRVQAAAVSAFIRSKVRNAAGHRNGVPGHAIDLGHAVAAE